MRGTCGICGLRRAIRRLWLAIRNLAIGCRRLAIRHLRIRLAVWSWCGGHLYLRTATLASLGAGDDHHQPTNENAESGDAERSYNVSRNLKHAATTDREHEGLRVLNAGHLQSILACLRQGDLPNSRTEVAAGAKADVAFSQDGRQFRSAGDRCHNGDRRNAGNR